jgi:outer membrane protein TolC
MCTFHSKVLIFLLSIAGVVYEAKGQVLSLKDAVNMAVTNYGTIKAKANYVNASKALVKETQREYLPDLNLSFQQDYGTINSISGPTYGYKGLSVGSSGPVLPTQNWNSAFGSLYLTNVNWDFFSFGKAKEKIKVAQTALARDSGDLVQEIFQDQVKVAAAYLNLLAAQRITISQQNNLNRAVAFRDVVVARVKNGLNPGVDSSQANAEVSNAKILLIQSKDFEQEKQAALAQLMGVDTKEFSLDSEFVKRIPSTLYDSAQFNLANHPLLTYYKSRITLSDEQIKYYRTFNYPTFSLFGVMQGRGSGFDRDYGANNLNGYSHSYWEGANPSSGNYLVGVGMVWNLTTPLRIHQLAAAQKFNSQGLQNEYDLISQQIKNQLILSSQKIKNALDNYAEAPMQVKAASDAYLQKTVLYRNGLGNIVDVTQAAYALNRAETDRDIADNNVWQALLLKAAASGDFGLFINEF